ncbi:MAG: hypothetical protein AB7O97_02610 [Planctomycetota bacterium]
MALGILALGAVAPDAAAQQAEPARDGSKFGDIRVGADGFVLPAGQVELTELVAAAAFYLQRNLLAEPEELARTAPLHFQKELALDALGCEDVVTQLLYMRGFAVIEVDAARGLYEVLLIAGPRGAEVVERAPCRSADAVLRRPHLKQYVFTEVQLDCLDAEAAADQLRRLLGAAAGPSQHRLGGVVFGALGNARTLLLAGFQDEVAQAIRLVRVCDASAAAAAGSTADPADEAAESARRNARPGTTRAN